MNGMDIIGSSLDESCRHEPEKRVGHCWPSLLPVRVDIVLSTPHSVDAGQSNQATRISYKAAVVTSQSFLLNP